MPKAKTNQARKKPKQLRSQQTVTDILDACEKVLAQEGYEKTSTNKVAQKAGVSIGSLYQYYPNKEALIAALIDRELQLDRELIQKVLVETEEQGIEDFLKVLIQSFITSFLKKAKLRKEMIQEVPRVGKMGRLNEIKKDLSKVLLKRLHKHEDEMRKKDFPLAVFILVNSVEAAIYAAIFQYGKKLDQEMLTAEITEVVLRYLLTSET